MKSGVVRDFNYPNYTIPLLVLRLLVGGVFIYSAIFKINKITDFSKYVSNYKIIPYALRGLVSFVFPWIELTIGIFFVVGIFLEQTAVVCSVLLIAMTLLTVIETKNGLAPNCGCFPEGSILNSSNPLFITIRNLIIFLGVITISILKHSANYPRGVSIKRNLINKSIILLIFSASMIFLLNLKLKRFEEENTSKIMAKRQVIVESYESIIGEKLFEKSPSLIKSFVDANGVAKKYYLLIYIKSLDCDECVNDAVFAEELFSTFKSDLCVFGVTSVQSNYAISNFQKKNNLSYQIFRDSEINLMANLGIKATLIKLLLSPDGEVLKVDPASHNIKSIEEEFKSDLANLLKKKEMKDEVY
ncbi:MAG: MauE/DoxX family redox-associated membrane protein [Candidatus Aminicenantales bacterium]